MTALPPPPGTHSTRVWSRIRTGASREMRAMSPWMNLVADEIAEHRDAAAAELGDEGDQSLRGHFRLADHRERLPRQDPGDGVLEDRPRRDRA